MDMPVPYDRLSSGHMMTERSRQHGPANSSCKVFVGGLSWDTTDEKLRAYFENFGAVKEAFVSYCRETGRPRGFGFVVFESPQVCDRVVQHKHTIDRREVDAKHAMPRAEALGLRTASGGSEQLMRHSRKLFIGGLPANISDAMLRQHFEQLGPVEDAVVMMDHQSKRSRGFGFVSFANEHTAELVLQLNPRPILFGRQIEIKRAVPREQLQYDAYARQRRIGPAMVPGLLDTYALPGSYLQPYAGAPAFSSQPSNQPSNCASFYMPPESDVPMHARFDPYASDWGHLLECQGAHASAVPPLLDELHNWPANGLQYDAASPPAHMASLNALSAPMHQPLHADQSQHNAGASMLPRQQATSAPAPLSGHYGAMRSTTPPSAGPEHVPSGIAGASSDAGHVSAFDQFAASLSAALPAPARAIPSAQAPQLVPQGAEWD